MPGKKAGTQVLICANSNCRPERKLPFAESHTLQDRTNDSAIGNSVGHLRGEQGSSCGTCDYLDFGSKVLNPFGAVSRSGQPAIPTKPPGALARTGRPAIPNKPSKMKIENLTDHNLSNGLGHVVPKCPFINHNLKLTNFVTGKQTKDLLHQHSKKVECNSTYCMGSLMAGQSPARTTTTPKPKELVRTEAEPFFQEYYQSNKKSKPEELQNRLDEVMEEIEAKGTWTPSQEELHFGAKLAWRNAARCIGRIQWSKLELNDARHITTTEEMYQALLKHLEYATNGGNIRSVITVFPQRVDGREDYRVWNPQLVSYAGYLQQDGTIVGDPSKVLFTRICQRLGWKGKGGRFDILPWIFSAPNEGAKFYAIPEELVLRVHLEHPKYPWFADLGLEWYCVPAVADMMLDMGGVEFPACPFNGWYMGSEIGARDLCDPQRYNVTEEVAAKMGLDTSNPLTLWKDLVLVEVNVAVLYSYKKSQVTLVDHHTASEQFMKHFQTEQKLRGGCPADWVWIVPPMSGSLTSVYHQEMLSYILKPSFEYQEKAWKTYKWGSSATCKVKYSLSAVAKASLWACCLMNLVRHKRVPCTIIYASETGKSETFAYRLAKLARNAFNTRVLCMSDYNIDDLSSENLFIVVASTFGTGEAPDNGKEYWKEMQEITKFKKLSLEGMKFAVFALGSTHYPTFCAFGKDVDSALANLGGQRLLAVGLGDELRGQEQTFHQWAEELYMVACTNYNLNVDVGVSIASFEADDTWDPQNFRAVALTGETKHEVCVEMSRLHKKKISPCKVLSRAKLQARHSDRQTILIRLDTQGATELHYEPGDHLGVYPCNSSNVVTPILEHLRGQGYKNEVMQAESLSQGVWKSVQRLPPCTMETALTRYLDICCPPTAHILSLLSDTTTQNWDKYRLKRLAKVIDEYEEWRSYRYPNLAEVLEEFPSIKLTPAFILTQLPLLQPRYYSISSSRLVTPNEVHLTMTLVTYNTQDGKGPSHQGVCTSYLNSFPDDDVACFVRAAPSFHVPESKKAPILMVGAGSGVAPFRGFWQKREMDMRAAMCLKNSNDLTDSDEDHDFERLANSDFGPMVLVFGCRQSNMDNIYTHETNPLMRKAVLQKVVTAYSRQPGERKMYVQDALYQEGKMVYDMLIKKNGHMYVCGDAVMADGVRTVTKMVIEAQGNISASEAEEIFHKALSEGRYHEDVFGVLRSSDNQLSKWQRKTEDYAALHSKAIIVKTRRTSTRKRPMKNTSGIKNNLTVIRM